MTILFEPSGPTTRDALPTIIRLVAAAAVLIGGLAHLQLYFSGYRNIPDIGRSFALNGLASIVVAGALAVRRDVVVRLAAAALATSTVVAFALSRTDRGVFGFQERGLEPWPQTAVTLIAEVVVVIAVGTTFLPGVGPGEALRPRVAAATLLVGAIVSIGATATWAGSDDSSATQSATPTTAPAATSLPSVATTDGPAGSVTDTSIAPSPPSSTGAENDTATQPDTTEPRPAESDATDQESGERDDGVVVVSIVDFAFVEQELEIPVGATVRWVNDDSFAHSVVADDGSFVSERLEPGDEFEFTFETAGQFDYICGLHPSMTAAISVMG